MKANNFDPLAAVEAANPLPAAELTALEEGPDRERTLALIFAEVAETHRTQGSFRISRLLRRPAGVRRRRPSVRAFYSGPHRALSHRAGVMTVVAIAFLGVLVPVALAFRSQIIDVITGKPAPLSVAQSFSAWNRVLKGKAEVPGKPFADVMQAVTDQAVGVLSLQTPRGPLNLWAAPEVGGGKCFMLQINVARETSDNGFNAIGSCDSQMPRLGYSNPKAILPWPVSFGEIPDVSFVMVRVFDAASVDVKFSDGSTTPLRIVDSFALAAIPADSIPPGARPAVTVIAKDKSGNVIASDPLRYESSSD
jgi:hypothetical protein